MSFLDDFYSQLFVQSWTMAIGYQAGTALVDLVSNWKKKDDPDTDYYRVIKRGEIRNGWKLAIPRSSLCNGFHDSPVVDTSRYTSAVPLPSDDDEPWPSTWKSVVFEVRAAFVNGGQIHCIRQYSLIKPSASSTLLKIYSRRAYQWFHAGHCYLNANTLVILFENSEPDYEYRVFLVNVQSRKCRSFRISPPTMGTKFMHAYSDMTDERPHLRLVFFQRFMPEGEQRRQIIDAKYVLPDSAIYREDLILEATSIDSILFPINHSRVHIVSNGCPLSVMFYNKANMHDTDAVVCIMFDRNGWSSISLTEWLRRYESTSDGRAVLNAAKAFVDLRPPSGWNWDVPVPAIVPLGRALVFPGFVLGETDRGGIIRRWIRPPSALQLAAEAIFRARPDVKMAEIEKATGVDVSDGIREDGTEEDAIIISL